MNQRKNRFFITYFLTSLFVFLLLFPALSRTASGKETVDPYHLWHLFTGSARTGGEHLSAVAVDDDGNIFIAAEGLKWSGFQETDPNYGSPGQPLHWHSGNADNNKDILVVKFGPDGEFKWYTYYGGFEEDTVRGMTIVDGRLYITGTSRDNWGGPNNESAVNQHSRAIVYYVRDGVGGGYGHDYKYYSGDIYALALNADSGGYLWHTFHGESKWNEEVYGIAADKERVFLVGKADAEFFGCWPKMSGSELTQYVTEDDMERVERLCQPTRAYQGGNDAWAMTLRASDGGWVKHTFLGSSASDDWGEAIAIDKEGFPVVVGSSSKQWNYDDHVHYNASPRNSHSGGFDMFVARLARNDLEYHWHSFFGGTDDDWATAVAVDDNNKYYLAGYSQSNWPVHDNCPVVDHTVPVPDYDFVVMKTDNEGRYTWHTFRGGEGTEDVPHAMSLSSDGTTVYVAGEARGPWRKYKYGDGNPIHGFSGDVGITDMAILGLDASSGRSRWYTFWGGLGADRAYSVATDPTTGGIVVGGTTDVSWRGDNNEESKYTFPNNGDAVLNPNFAVLKLRNYKFAINASVSGGNGTITPAGKTLVKPGADQTFTFTPNLGYGIAQVILDDKAQDWSTDTYTIPKVASDHTIKVVFKRKDYTITSSAGTGGTINPAGNQTVGRGSSRQFTVTASEGYVIDTLTVVKGTTTETIKAAADQTSYAYTFTNVTANGSITATFKTKTYTITSSAGTGGTINPAGNQIVGRGGNSQKFTVTAGDGYVIDTLTVVKGTTTETIKAAADKASYTYRFIDVTADGSITAKFKQFHTITATEGNGGSMSPEGDQIVGNGKNITFTITADVTNGYVIDTLAVDGNTVTAASGQSTYSYPFTNVTQNHAISVTFKKPQHITIAVSAGQNGTISPGTSQMERDTTKTFTIAASDGYGIDTLTVDGNVVAGASGRSTYTYTFAKVTEDHTISATFKEQSIFTIKTWLSTGGTISPRENTTVTKGGSQLYTIEAGTGYVIAKLTVVKGTISETITAAADQTSYAYTFTNVQADGSITVSFKSTATTYTIDASAGSNGTISPSGSVSVTSGGSQTFTISALDGYEVENVLVDNQSQGAITTYTFTNVTANHTITVTFKQKPATTYTIDASAGSNGTISPSGSVSVTSGGSQTFTISASNGYEVADVLVDGQSQGATATYTFTNVTANHTISVTFKKPATKYTITASAEAGGTISPDGVTEVDAHGSQTYTISPELGKVIDAVWVDGEMEENPDESYTFNDVTANHTIRATFKN
ncbi:MAG: hypothetical protein PHC90_01645 [Syntrophorhabdaceae bacterium]|nr:hypothetical protein [Syntrophorhabdaceae bacterium]